MPIIEYLCDMLELRDQIGVELKLEGAAKRIVSVVPSQTELLFDIGLQDEWNNNNRSLNQGQNYRHNNPTHTKTFSSSTSSSSSSSTSASSVASASMGPMYSYNQ